MATIKVSKIISGNIYRDIKERKIIWNEFDGLLNKLLNSISSYREIKIEITVGRAKPTSAGGEDEKGRV